MRVKTTQSKAFHCDFCEYKASRKEHIKIHNKAVHLKIRDQACHICEYLTSNACNLRKHVRRVHGRSEVPAVNGTLGREALSSGALVVSNGSKVKGRLGGSPSVASPSKDGKRKGKPEEEDGKKRQRTSSRNTPDRTDDDDDAGSGDNKDGVDALNDAFNDASKDGADGSSLGKKRRVNGFFQRCFDATFNPNDATAAQRFLAPDSDEGE